MKLTVNYPPCHPPLPKLEQGPKPMSQRINRGGLVSVFVSVHVWSFGLAFESSDLVGCLSASAPWCEQRILERQTRTGAQTLSSGLRNLRTTFSSMARHQESTGVILRFWICGGLRLHLQSPQCPPSRLLPGVDTTGSASIRPTRGLPVISTP